MFGSVSGLRVNTRDADWEITGGVHSFAVVNCHIYEYMCECDHTLPTLCVCVALYTIISRKTLVFVCNFF